MRWQLVRMTLTGLAVLTTGLSASPAVDDTTVANATPTVAVQRVSVPPAVRDEAAMVLVSQFSVPVLRPI